jgi:hypothetical protein
MTNWPSKGQFVIASNLRARLVPPPRRYHRRMRRTVADGGIAGAADGATADATRVPGKRALLLLAAPPHSI